MNHKITEEEKQIRKERVLYIYFKLKEKNTKVFIESFVKKQGITSESTARRIFTDASDWKKSEISLFIATYTPVKSDSEAIEEVLGLNASKVSNEVTEDDIEAAHIINELSAKNEELQKELHTSKNVIVTLQKMTAELNEAITESKCMIHEICKERDEKAEEIRVLNLELQHYISDIEYDMRKYTNPPIKVEELEKEEAVNHPKHYNNIAGIECIDVVENFNFNRGNAIKYVWRAGEKSKEKEVEDLKKAIFYIEREVKNLQEVK